MARLPDLVEFARAHGLKIGTIADLIHYRSRTESLVERIAERPIDDARTARSGSSSTATSSSDATHLALVRGPLSPGHRDAGARARAAVGDGPARRRTARRIRGRSRRRSRRSPTPGRGVDRAAAPARKRAGAAPARAIADAAAGVAEDRPAQLRHRRADPARPQRRPDAAAWRGRARCRAWRASTSRSPATSSRRARRARRRRRELDADVDAHRSRTRRGDGRRVGIVVSRFNAAIGDGLLAGALRALAEAGVAERDIVVVTVPGALESAARAAAARADRRLRRAGRAGRGDPRRDLPLRDRRQRIGGRRRRACSSSSASRSATAS